MRTERTIGLLLILGAIGVLIPYTILTITFDYPDILRQDAGIILSRFHEGGSSLIFVWFLFALLGLPFIPAYILIGQKLEGKKVEFQTIHQFGGVLLGEHLGQLFTIIWTVMMCIAFDKLRLFPKWLVW